MSENLEKETYTKDEVEALIAERNSGLVGNKNAILNELKDARTKLASFDGVDLSAQRTMADLHAKEISGRISESNGQTQRLERVSRYASTPRKWHNGTNARAPLDTPRELEPSSA